MSQGHKGTSKSHPKRVVVAIASSGRVHHACRQAIRDMIWATTAAKEVACWWQSDQPHDRCRNMLLDRFLRDSRWTHLLFVDTDEIAAPETLDKLLSHDAPLVCGSVPTLHQRYGPPDQRRGVTVGTNIMVFDDPSLRGTVVDPEEPEAGYRRMDPDDFPDHPFVCDASGLGLCLIQRKVIEQVERPWCRFAGKGLEEQIGEDVYFFRKARAAGFKLLVDPSVAVDHLKLIDLTHLDLLYSDKLPVSPWPRLAEPNETLRVFVAVRVPRTGWLQVRSAEVLQTWERQYPDRVLVEPILADTLRGGFMELHKRVQSLDARFTHVLVLGDDVVPHQSTLGLLASVDVPIVAGLTRRLIDGRICWSYWLDDPIPNRLVAPQNIHLPELTQPFEVRAVDLACVLIRRQALRSVPSVRDLADNGPDADQVFAQRWCRAVTEATGVPPYQTPLTVERRFEIGLKALLNIKMMMKAQLRTQMHCAAAPSL